MNYNEEKKPEKPEKKILIPIIFLNSFMILISLYLSILYIKSKRLHILACANFIILSFIILFDNILRIIPLPDDKEALHYVQAFLLIFLDKLLLSTIVFQTFITYFGVVKTKFYYKHEKKIFFSGFIINLIICIVLAIVFLAISEELESYGLYYYCQDKTAKHTTDAIFNGIYLFINSFCIIILLIYMSTKKEEAEEGIIEDLDYGKHFSKILSMFIINTLAFIESFLIIYDKIPVPDDYVDLVYLITCLIIDLFYTMNKIIMKETLKLFCPKIYEMKYPENKEDSLISNKRTESKETEMMERKDSFDSD